MSRRRPVHALVRAVRAAGGTVETVRGRVRVVLPPGVPRDDRALLTVVLRALMGSEATPPATQPRSGRRTSS
jgi:hypothetical protein